MDRPTSPERVLLGVGPKLMNIGISEISVVPKVANIWRPNSRTKPQAGGRTTSSGAAGAAADAHVDSRVALETLRCGGVSVVVISLTALGGWGAWSSSP